MARERGKETIRIRNLLKLLSPMSKPWIKRAEHLNWFNMSFRLSFMTYDIFISFPLFHFCGVRLHGNVDGDSHFAHPDTHQHTRRRSPHLPGDEFRRRIRSSGTCCTKGIVLRLSFTAARTTFRRTQEAHKSMETKKALLPNETSQWMPLAEMNSSQDANSRLARWREGVCERVCVSASHVR